MAATVTRWGRNTPRRRKFCRQGSGTVPVRGWIAATDQVRRPQCRHAAVIKDELLLRKSPRQHAGDAGPGIGGKLQEKIRLRPGMRFVHARVHEQRLRNARATGGGAVFLQAEWLVRERRDVFALGTRKLFRVEQVLMRVYDLHCDCRKLRTAASGTGSEVLSAPVSCPSDHESDV